jgi:hypothetical protein
MVARPHWIRLAAALAATAACSRGSLPDSGRPGTAAASGSLGGSSGGSSIVTGAGGGQNCGAISVPAPMASLDVLVLLDASGSMNDDASGMTCEGGCGAGSKWAQTAAAIDNVVAQTDASVNWGLMLFGNFGADGCTVGSYPAVPVAPANAGAIAAAFAARPTAGGGLPLTGSTPTRVAVDSASGYLATVLDGNRKLIVLATDSAPNCAPGGSDPGAADTDATVDAVRSAMVQGFPTFVVAVAIPDNDSVVLDEMAAAGGLERSTLPSYWAATDTAGMAAILGGFVGGASRCLFSIPDPPTVDLNRTDVAVMLDGAGLPHDSTHANGWDYTDNAETHLQIYGPACDAIAGQPAAHAVTVTFLCLID